MTTDNQPEHAAVRHRWYIAVAFWVVNLALLLTVSGWVFNDGRSLEKLSSLPSDGGLPAAVVVGLILVSLVGILVGLFRGPTWRRSLKAWLAFTALVSAWCGLCVSWQSLYFFGQSVRLRAELPQYQALVQELRDQWPGKDGESPQLGHFLAYPLAEPRTLLLVGIAQVPGAAPLAAVERSEKGALRFQLAGEETGAWLEWHPPASAPDSFVGGLQNHYTLLRQRPLQPGWYLTHYRER
jgi:hypothetical protein